MGRAGVSGSAYLVTFLVYELVLVLQSVAVQSHLLDLDLQRVDDLHLPLATVLSRHLYTHTRACKNLFSQSYVMTPGGAGGVALMISIQR